VIKKESTLVFLQPRDGALGRLVVALMSATAHAAQTAPPDPHAASFLRKCSAVREWFSRALLSSSNHARITPRDRVRFEVDPFGPRSGCQECVGLAGTQQRI